MALYKQYCDGMFIIAQRYMKETAAAEDAMQEAFIKAFQKLNQFKGDITKNFRINEWIYLWGQTLS